MKTKPDYWKQLVKLARESDPAPLSMPFGFESGVLSILSRGRHSDTDLFYSWIPLLRAGVAFSGLIVLLTLALNYNHLNPELNTGEVAIVDSVLAMSLNP